VKGTSASIIIIITKFVLLSPSCYPSWLRDWLGWSDVSDRSKKIGALLWSKVLRYRSLHKEWIDPRNNYYCNAPNVSH